MKFYEMSCDFNFVFEQRDHVCKREKTVHFAVDCDRMSLVGALITGSPDSR